MARHFAFYVDRSFKSLQSKMDGPDVGVLHCTRFAAANLNAA